MIFFFFWTGAVHNIYCAALWCCLLLIWSFYFYFLFIFYLLYMYFIARMQRRMQSIQSILLLSKTSHIYFFYSILCRLCYIHSYFCTNLYIFVCPFVKCISLFSLHALEYPSTNINENIFEKVMNTIVKEEKNFLLLLYNISKCI